MSRLFRIGKCALASLYAVYRDGHTPARQFLIAALQNPVMAVLAEDEFFLDIDPDKAMERLVWLLLLAKAQEYESVVTTPYSSKKTYDNAIFQRTNPISRYRNSRTA